MVESGVTRDVAKTYREALQRDVWRRILYYSQAWYLALNGRRANR